MRRTIVNNPKYSFGGAIRLLLHHIAYQAIKRYDTRFSFTVSENFGTINVPSSYIRQRTAPFLFKFNFHTFAFSRVKGRVFSTSDLDTRLFVSTENEFIRLQFNSFPNSLVQIQYTPGFMLKLRISWKYPTTILPWFDSIFMQPTPDGRTTNLSNDSSANSLCNNLICAKAGQWYLFFKGQFTSQCFDLYNNVRKKKRTGVRCAVYPLFHQGVLRKIFFSICLQFVVANLSALRLFYFLDLERPSRQFSLEQLDSMVTYIGLQFSQVLFVLHRTTQLHKGFFLAYILSIIKVVYAILYINIFILSSIIYVTVIMNPTT